MYSTNFLRTDLATLMYDNDIEKEYREERHKEYNEMLRRESPERQVSHFKRQEKILIDNVESAKSDAERYIAVKRLSICRQNLSKWKRIVEEMEKRGR